MNEKGQEHHFKYVIVGGGTAGTGLESIPGQSGAAGAQRLQA